MTYYLRRLASLFLKLSPWKACGHMWNKGHCQVLLRFGSKLKKRQAIKDATTMKKLLFITLLLLSSLPANAQHLDSLLNDFFQLEIRDLPNHEKLAKEIFEIDPFNESVCHSLCLSYDRNKQEERKNKFFKELKEKYPKCPEPWILSAEFNCWALRTEDTTCFPELDMALQIDSTNVKGYFLYARTLTGIHN